MPGLGLTEQATDAAKSTDTKTIANIMQSGMTFHTAIGDISSDKKGDIKQAAYGLYTWTKQPDGTITSIENDRSLIDGRGRGSARLELSLPLR